MKKKKINKLKNNKKMKTKNRVNNSPFKIKLKKRKSFKITRKLKK